MLNKKLISIDFGSKNVSMIEGFTKDTLIEIQTAVVFPAPTNSIVDGRVEDKLAIKEALKSSLAINHIRSKNTIITIQSSSVITRDIILPEIQKEQLADMIRYEIEQYLPSNVDDYVLEFKVLNDVIEDRAKKYRIRVAAMPKSIVDVYLDILNSLKLKPVALDIHSNSINKIFETGQIINGDIISLDKSYAFIDFGYSTTSVNIFSKGILEISRLINLAGRDLDTVIASYKNISLEKAEQHKISEYKVDASTEQSDFNSQSEDPVKASLYQWSNEIQKIFQYFTSRSQGSRINTIYLHGGSSNIKGLSDFVKNTLNVNRVEAIKRIDNVKFEGAPGNFDIKNFANALGAMIRKQAE